MMLVEEIASERRGWAVGLLGALSALGYVLAALAYSWIDVMPLGWRGLYIFALLPLLIVIPTRRLLPESVRFEKAAGEWRAVRDGAAEMREFARPRIPTHFSVFAVPIGTENRSFGWGGWLADRFERNRSEKSENK